MTRSHEHEADAHGHHRSAHHGAHEPGKGIRDEYERAYASSQPAPGCRVVTVHLEAAEIDWEFVPGQLTRAWAYNGQVPGPLIEANVGDVLEVRFRNSLPEPTLIHWHGLRLHPVMDGTESVQRAVMPGEAFTYRFFLPDAGTFWYHPHVNEPVQLERGLYGAIIVRGADELQVDGERTLVFDDIGIDDEGQIKPPGWWIEKHDGRQGEVRLINGRSEPTIVIAGGQVERWRVVNASSARYVQLSIGDAPFRILGTDGGLITAPFTATEVLLTPGDRIDLAVGPFSEEQTLPIESLAYRRGSFRKRGDERFGTLEVQGSTPSRAVIPDRLREIEPLVSGIPAPTRTVRFGYKVRPTNGVEFVINDEAHHRADPVRLGELQIWEIVNETPVDHPFHLHGYFFQVLDVEGQAPAYLSWEDTVNVPARSRVRIAWMPDERPGTWMYHCHILEHHAHGMMAHFDVVS